VRVAQVAATAASRARTTHLAIGALVAMAGFAGAPSVQAATRHLAAQSASPSCSLASATKIKSALGITVSAAPSVTRNGPVTVCQFRVATGLLVRFQTSETAALFAFGRKSFATHGETTRTLNGIGTKAYSSTIGKEVTVVVLQNKTELLILARAPLAKVEALAKLILPSL
jgi:hypothetical protein